MAIKVRLPKVRSVTVPMASLLEQKLANVKTMIRREFELARAAGRDPSVACLSATARKIKAEIEQERARS